MTTSSANARYASRDTREQHRQQLEVGDALDRLARSAGMLPRSAAMLPSVFIAYYKIVLKGFQEVFSQI